MKPNSASKTSLQENDNKGTRRERLREREACIRVRIVRETARDDLASAEITDERHLRIGIVRDHHRRAARAFRGRRHERRCTGDFRPDRRAELAEFVERREGV